MSTVSVRAARIADVKAIHALLLYWAGEGKLLPRSLSQLYANLRDFIVITEKNEQNQERLVGCCALALFWEDLAEVRSLAVAPDCCRKGYGRRLIDVIVAEARTLGLRKLFSLTYQTEFFAAMGFSQVSKDILPQKIWSECVNCPRFPDCDEVAVMRELELEEPETEEKACPAKGE